MPSLLKKHKTQFDKLRPRTHKDSLPSDVRKLIALQQKLSKEDQHIFNHNVDHLKTRAIDIDQLRKEGITSGSLSDLVFDTSKKDNLRDAKKAKSYRMVSKKAKTVGSTNIQVMVKGTSPGSGTRFVRYKMHSVVIKEGGDQG